ncbi:MAG TPA: amidohydrolase family protein [Pseudonocardiaceae bacterium]|jgi:enamidase|nr:amidohydrolase family protein [Pseudonocardiaceae bacterium]
MSLAVVNIGPSHDGSLAGGPITGDAVVCTGDTISWIGPSTEVDVAAHDQLVDAAGATLVPGLIDSHVHTTFGDFTPRQQTVGFLDSYVHGGTTRAISASEVHVPGRPTDPVGVKALAVAAARCFEHFRPGGMTVHAGSVILEPGLTLADFQELKANGVWLAKGGFGGFADARDYIPVVADAKAAGITVMCHSGGGSIPGSKSKIDAELLLDMRPQIAGHINGGPTSLTPAENALIVAEGSDIALQLVHAGNLRSAIDIAERALAKGDLHRILIATDTPTGTGVIPLGMLRQLAEMVSLGPLTPEQAITAATGNVAATYGLTAGRIAVGAPADLVVLDTPIGSGAEDAFGALRIGDLPAIGCVITEGQIRVSRSRNTPPPSRGVTCRIR